MPIPDSKQPVIVGELRGDPDRGRPVRAFIGYRLGPGEGVSFADVSAAPEVVAAYARTAAGDIWRYHEDGYLSLNSRERYALRTLDGKFSPGPVTVHTNGVSNRAEITEIVLVTRRSADLEVAALETGETWNDIVTRYRLLGSQKHARYHAAGPQVVQLGTRVRGRYGERVPQIDSPASGVTDALGVSGRYPYAFVKYRDSNPHARRPEYWEIVTPDTQLPITVNQPERTRTGIRTPVEIVGVLDWRTERGVTPMASRKIEDPFSKADKLEIRALTAKLHQREMRDQSRTR